MKNTTDSLERLSPTGGSPVRVTLSRARGWRMPANTVKVCRPSKWGNPFRAEDYAYGGKIPPKSDTAWWHGMNEWMVQLYTRWLDEGAHLTGASAPPTIEEMKRELAGKNLACWCRQDAPCHADVLLRLTQLLTQNDAFTHNSNRAVESSRWFSGSGRWHRLATPASVGNCTGRSAAEKRRNGRVVERRSMGFGSDAEPVSA